MHNNVWKPGLGCRAMPRIMCKFHSIFFAGHFDEIFLFAIKASKLVMNPSGKESQFDKSEIIVNSEKNKRIFM